MKVLFPALRVGALEPSVDFYETVGLEVVGRVETDDTRMAMLAAPGAEEVCLELVETPARGPVHPGGLDHLAVQVDDLRATRTRLLAAGLPVGELETPGGPDGPLTATVPDPDGHHLELVEWPAGHPVAMTRADFAPPPERTTDPEEPTA
ncbi:VOC family protein [Phycicoccus sonneratiae]|uniref:VOC family protein n=1 Tax=Phycicoccus sonneratiae TaxID=2807628 RepID=A0ABS2CQ03_9MICO|nr:VOC family protein [Phycicoccus sonneraticus]MBM6401956.1 VOC family protein [Phycicoccus sonneraticus]